MVPILHYKAEGTFEYEDKNILQAEDRDALMKKDIPMLI